MLPRFYSIALAFLWTHVAADAMAAPTFKTHDGYFQVTPIGRLQLDAGYVIDDSNTTANTNADIRRLWTGVDAKAGDHWSGRFVLSWENKQTDIQDFYARYNTGSNWRFALGQYREYTDMENSSGNSNTLLMEYATANQVFAGIRRVGLGAEYYANQNGFQAGIFTRNLNNNPADDDGYTLASRAYRFWHNPDEQQRLHLGIFARYRNQKEPFDRLRWRGRGESRVIENR